MSHWKPLQLSLFFHGIILITLIMYLPPVKQHNVLIVDFTMGNEPVQRDGGAVPPSRSPLKPPKKKAAHRATTAVVPPNENQLPHIIPESSAKEETVQVETQPPAVTAAENFFQANVDLAQFSQYASQGGGSDSRFQKLSSPGHSRSGSARGESVSSARSQYLRAHFSYIKDLIHKHLVYPAQAKKMGWEGKVITTFVVSSEGYAKDIRISKSSGHEILDENAVKAIKNASPFPKPPVEAQIIIPILYRLN
jgi:periplasmic protein TonB